MIPAIAEASSTSSCRLDFNEPLDDLDRRTIEALTELYVGKEHPLMTFSRDGKTTLVIPKTIVRIFPNADSLTTQSPSSLRIPDGTGASNGN